MSEPTVYTHCSDWYLGVHGSGVGAKGVADGSMRASLGGRKGVPIKLGRSRQDMPFECVGEGVPRGSRSIGSVSVRIVDIVHVMVLRSVH